MLTCFSSEAHSIVPSCEEVLQKLEDKDPYRVPPELAALEQKAYIFQLHYGSESTKEQKFFFLDKAWDVTQALAALPEPVIDTQATETTTTPTVEDAIITDISTPPTIAEQQISIQESCSTTSEKKPTKTRKALFQTTKPETETPSAKKKNKKDD